MFSRFKLTYQYGDELVGVGVIMPNGEAYINFFNPQHVGRDYADEDSVWGFSSGIARVVEMAEENDGVEFKWIDDPAVGGWK